MPILLPVYNSEEELRKVASKYELGKTREIRYSLTQEDLGREIRNFAGTNGCVIVGNTQFGGVLVSQIDSIKYRARTRRARTRR